MIRENTNWIISFFPAIVVDSQVPWWAVWAFTGATLLASRRATASRACKFRAWAIKRACRSSCIDSARWTETKCSVRMRSWWSAASSNNLARSAIRKTFQGGPSRFARATWPTTADVSASPAAVPDRCATADRITAASGAVAAAMPTRAISGRIRFFSRRPLDGRLFERLPGRPQSGKVVWPIAARRPALPSISRRFRLHRPILVLSSSTGFPFTSSSSSRRIRKNRRFTADPPLSAANQLRADGDPP